MNLKKVGFQSFATSLLLTGILSCSYTNAEKEINKNKEYIKNNAPDKYKKLEELDNFGFSHSLIRRYRYWEQNATAISDSIRMDSIAKSNYAKGVQMVQDKIKTIK